ncbi:MAG: histone deacetylase [Alphaproteobacteria bacterium]|nr:histone deacetylase [Alphaproteobacteria bacterium]
MRTHVFTDRQMTRHDPGQGHPERPQRLSALLDSLTFEPLAHVSLRAAQAVPREALLRAHDADHVALVESARGQFAAFDPDTRTSPDSVEAAGLAAGAALQAVEAVVRGEADNAFAMVRPPGHHATGDRAMGFCLLNNVAVAAAHARAALGIERVLIVDWDVHHGNGTQAIFEHRGDVAFFSTHAWPMYPGTGAAHERGRGEGEGATVNVPMGRGSGDLDLAEAFEAQLLPLAQRFRPELVLVSAGFDAHHADPLGVLQLTEVGFAHLCGVTKHIADTWAQGRLVLSLEGGYDVDALVRSARACLRVMGGESAPTRAEISADAR